MQSRAKIHQVAVFYRVVREIDFSKSISEIFFHIHQQTPIPMESQSQTATGLPMSGYQDFSTRCVLMKTMHSTALIFLLCWRS